MIKSNERCYYLIYFHKSKWVNVIHKPGTQHLACHEASNQIHDKNSLTLISYHQIQNKYNK